MDTSKECLVSESNAGELLQMAGYCNTKVKASSPEEDSCSLSLKEKPDSTQSLDTDGAALEQLSTDLEMRSRNKEMNEEPSDSLARGTTPKTTSSTPALFHSEDSMANTTGEPQLRDHLCISLDMTILDACMYSDVLFVASDTEHLG